MKIPPELGRSDREGVNDASYFRQLFAGLKIAPLFAIAVGEAAEAVALHDGEILHRGGGQFFLFAYGKFAHGLNHGCFFRR